MIVIIAEKPSLGRAIASALPTNFVNQDGYLKSEEIIVTWAFGHLFELKDIEDYKEEYRGMRWDQIPLPYCPNPFQFQLKKDLKTKKIDKGIQKQFKTICDLINSPSTREIVCCGDADREGEVIVRLILYAGLKDKGKKITRLWLPEQTEKGILEGFQNRDLDANYDDLYNEGISRTYIDWLLGINLSRSLSVRSGTALSVGRVICPIVQAIYNRDMAIKNFVPEKYNQIETKNPIPMTSKYKFKQNELNLCTQRRNAYNSNPAEVIDIQKKQETPKAPRLFSLSKLQGACGKKYKLSPKTTLGIVQSLYEKGFVTYPRTNTEFLAENEKDKVQDLLSIHGQGKTVFKDTKQIFDDSKIESHSALTPTYKVAKGLSDLEQKVYALIMNRFLANFWKEPFIKEVTEAKIFVGNDTYNEEIKVKGSIVCSKGWTEIEDTSSKDVLLPPLEKGEKLSIEFEIVQKETQPPKRYTASSLNEYLKHPFKKDDDDIEEEYRQLFLGCEIGTEATRADIIDKAIQKQYISLSKNVYSIESKGVFLVEIMQQLHLDMSVKKTVDLQKTLKAVYHHQITVNDAIMNAMNFLNEYFVQSEGQTIEQYDRNQDKVVGKCPWCGQPIIGLKGKFGKFYAHAKKSDCQFLLGSKIKIYGQGVNLTETAVKQLLIGKAISGSLISKKGSPYKVKIKLLSQPKVWEGKKYPDFQIEFAPQRGKK